MVALRTLSKLILILMVLHLPTRALDFADTDYNLNLQQTHLSKIQARLLNGSLPQTVQKNEGAFHPDFFPLLRSSKSYTQNLQKLLVSSPNIINISTRLSLSLRRHLYLRILTI